MPTFFWGGQSEEASGRRENPPELLVAGGDLCGARGPDLALGGHREARDLQGLGGHLKMGGEAEVSRRVMKPPGGFPFGDLKKKKPSKHGFPYFETDLCGFWAVFLEAEASLFNIGSGSRRETRKVFHF